MGVATAQGDAWMHACICRSQLVHVSMCMSLQDVVRGYKNQMAEARGLKETSEPEFQDKYSRIVELRNLRSSYLTRVKTIKDTLKEFDCKNEDELNKKINEIEHRITHEVSTCSQQTGFSVSSTPTACPFRAASKQPYATTLNDAGLVTLLAAQASSFEFKHCCACC